MRANGRLDAGTCALAAAVIAAVWYPALQNGAIGASARGVFVGLAGLALFVAVLVNGSGSLAVGRSVPVLALFGLALLSGLSGAWTVGLPSAAIRWGLVIAGYVALAVAAGVLSRRRAGLALILVAVVGLAITEGCLGVVGAIGHDLDLSERIGGVWRPEGTIGYSAAVALLQVAALPALLFTMCRAARGGATAAAGAGTVAAVTLAVAASRAELALAGCVLLGAALLLIRRDGKRGLEGLGAASLLVAVGVVAHLTLARYAAPRAPADAGQRIAVFVVLVAGAAVVWLLVRPRLARTRPPSWVGQARWRAAASTAVVAAAVIVALVAGGTSANAPSRRGIEPVGGLSHGRTHEWKAALQTWLDRPLAGGGADAYERASLKHQGSSPTLYAHDLPLEAAAELGVLGLALVIALYVTCGRAVVRARSRSARWLLGPAVAAFLLANLVDWPWHLPGVAAAWALALGGVVAGREPSGVTELEPRT
jgi:hypothetical protein